MGIFGKISGFISGSWEKIKDTTKKAADWVSDKVKKVFSKKKTKSELTEDNPYSDTTWDIGILVDENPDNEDILINWDRECRKMIDHYQGKEYDKAEELENFTKERYENSYKHLVDELSKIMDTSEITDHYKNKSRIFLHKMRNEVNDKISLNNSELMELMENRSGGKEEFKRRLNNYTQTVWNNAINNLLSELKKAVEETNEFIRKNTKKFLEDEVDALNQMNETRQALAQQGEVRNEELEKLGIEDATLSFILNESKKGKDTNSH